MKNYAGEGTLTKLCDLVKSYIGKLQNAVTTATEAADNAQSTANAAKETAEAALPKSGGIMTGIINKTVNDYSSHLYDVAGGNYAPYFLKTPTGFTFLAADIDYNPGESDAMKIGGIAKPRYEYDAANKLYVDSNIVRPNLLPNWYYKKPINQRGMQTYTNVGGTIDCVIITAGKINISLANDGLNITSTDVSYYHHYTEATQSKLAGIPITFTILRSNGILHTCSSIITSEPTWSLVNINFSGARFDIVIQENYLGYQAYIPKDFNETIMAVKIELGHNQTLAHKENGEWVLNEIPDYATELMKCQRYQIELTSPWNHFAGMVGVGVAILNNLANIFVNIPVTMNGVGTVIYKGKWYLMKDQSNWEEGNSVTNIIVNMIQPNGIVLNVSAENLTVGTVYFLTYQDVSLNTSLLIDKNL